MGILWTSAGLYRFAADAIVVLHVAYVLFVMLGLLATLIGRLLRWQWVHNAWFRIPHLTAIAIVVVEAWCGIVCPLTTIEADLREKAGDAHYQGDFIGHWAHECLFIDAAHWVFTVAYSLFGLVVLASVWLVPIRFRKRVAGTT